MSGATRRTALKIAGAATALAALRPSMLLAQEVKRRHGFAVIGEVKYGPEFRHFDYVNPNAPKGGRVATQAPAWAYNQNPTTFDTLNGFVLQGAGAVGTEITYATLMVGSSDEPGSVYCFAAEWVEMSEDGKRLRFALRPEARFYDGSPITADDVAFSLETLREKGHPNLALQLKGIEEIVAEDGRTIRLKLAETTGRSLPVVLATTPIFSKAWWGTRDFAKSLREPALGSAAYKVKAFNFGRYIEYELVPDFWGAGLPVMTGRYNLGVIRYDFYRDRDISLEALKKGDTTVREEFTSRHWATAYDFPAVKDGRVLKVELRDGSPSGAQGWYFNTRRQKFADRRVRQALGLAFDFEWTNRNLMYGSYRRTHSFLENSDLKAMGKPAPAELALLEPLRSRLTPDVFGEAYVPPASDGTGRDRTLIRRASELLAEAGCKVVGGRLTTPDGTPLTIEFLDDDNTFEPHHNAFIARLKLLGVDARYRVVDPTQYQSRTRSFDFDVAIQRITTPLYPDEWIRRFFSSESAKQDGSYNLAGIADPAVDALLEHVVHAKTWDEFVAAGRALDRVLRAGHYWVPQWNKASHWIAYWDMYDRPAEPPTYSDGILETWWYNPAKAARLGR